MKRIMGLVVVLSLIMTMLPLWTFPVYAVESSGTCGTNLTWELDEEGTLTISGYGAMNNYKSDTMPWYKSRKSIKAIVIGDGVTVIGNYAFYSCSSLESVQMPDSITNIKSEAFSGCSSLQSLELSKNLTTLGESAFAFCTALQAIHLPEGIQTLGNYAFRDCSLITSIVLPDSLVGIGQGAFTGTKIQSIKMPDKYTKIGLGAFRGCRFLERIVFSEDTTSIGSGAFASCTSLKTIELPESVTSIGKGAFSGCTALESIAIPEGVSIIADETFKGCTALKTVALPETIISIGTSAFESCTALETMKVPDDVSTIGNAAFKKCSSLKSIELPDQLVSMGTSVFEECTKISGITIPDSVATIGDSVFRTCLSLKTVKLSENLTAIEYAAFFSCTALESIKIPDSVTKIGSSAFQYCTALKSVDLSKNLKSIGNEAFVTCTSLEFINIPDSVTTIGQYSFNSCSSMKTVKLSEQLKTIGKAAFAYCKLLKSVNIPDEVTEIGESAFGSCSSLTTVKLPKNLDSIEFALFAECGKLESVQFPENLRSIGNYVFANCTSLESMEIPSSVTTIGNTAFYGCSSLKTIELPEGISSIGNGAFQRCESLESIDIPGGVTILDEDLFAACASLKSISIPGEIKTIKKRAFFNCPALRTGDVYFYGTEEQWEKIEIQAANEDLLSAKLHCLGPEKVDIPKGKYCIHVIDENGFGIQDADVVWIGADSVTQNIKTDEDGNALFQNGVDPIIQVSKEGYAEWENDDEEWKKDVHRYEIVTLYPSGVGEYKLRYARYSNSSDYKSGKDILVKTKKIALKNDGNLIGDLETGKFSLKCRANKPSAVKKYELWQGNNKIEESTTGEFSNLSVKNFFEGKSCFIQVVGNDGKKVKTSINLEFYKNYKNEKDELSVKFDEFSIAVRDDVPFLGGSTHTIKLPFSVPITYYESSDTQYLGINIKKNDEDDIKDHIKDIKTAAKVLSNPSTAKSLAEKYKSDLADKAQKSQDVSLLKKVKVTFTGYLERDIGSNAWTGCVIITAKIKVFSHQWQTVVEVVPVTAKVEIGFDTQGIAEKLVFNSDLNLQRGILKLKAKLGLEAFGGPGIGDAVGVGAYGKGSVTGEIPIMATEPAETNVDLEGEAGLKAYAGPFVYERPFLYHKWNLYNSTKKNASLAGSEADWSAGIYDASQYQLADWSYLSGVSFEPAVNDAAALQESSVRTEFSSLLDEECYRNAQPVAVSTNEGIYSVFLRGINIDADNGQKYAAAGYVMKLNDKGSCEGIHCLESDEYMEQVYTEGAPLFDDRPVICADETGNVWIAYTRATKQIEYSDSTGSMAQYAKDRELVIGKLDKTTLEFIPYRTFEASGYVNSQQLTCIDGVPTVLWIDSEITDDNSVLRPNSSHIKYSVLNGNDWGEEATIKTVNGAVDSFAAGTVEGNLAVAYLTGNKVFQITENGNGQQLADHVEGRLRFGRIPGTNEDSFLWNGDDVLESATGQTVEVAGITKEYVVIGNKIYYSSATDSGASLHVLKYDAGKWGLPIQLTNEKGYLENLNVVSLSGDDFTLGMMTNVSISEQTVTDSKEFVISKVMPVNNLQISGVSYEEEGLIPGDSMPLTVTVVNSGDHEVDAIDLSIDNEAVHAEECDLKPGDSLEIETSIVCPEEMTTNSVSVNEPNEDDYNPEDNLYEIKVGHPDVETTLEHIQTGSNHSVMATIMNNGIETASGKATLTDADGTVLMEHAFKGLASGDSQVILWPFDVSEVGIDGKDFYVQIILDQEEMNVYNNETSLYIPGPDFAVESVTRSESGTEVVIRCKRDLTGFSWCASYDGNGKMRTVVRTPLQAGENKIQLQDKDFDSLKVFVLDDENMPLCAAIKQG